MFLYEILGITVLFILIIFTGKLELKSVHCVEKGNCSNKLVRISSSKFRENPFVEIKRYITDTNYFNNIWRISALAASVITLLLFIPLFISGYNIPIWIFFPFTWFLIFTVCYHVWHFKDHHFHEFIYKTVGDSMDYLNKVPKLVPQTNVFTKGIRSFEQIIHP